MPTFGSVESGAHAGRNGAIGADRKHTALASGWVSGIYWRDIHPGHLHNEPRFPYAGRLGPTGNTGSSNRQYDPYSFSLWYFCPHRILYALEGSSTSYIPISDSHTGNAQGMVPSDLSD